MNAFRKDGGNTLLVVAAISIILMMGTLPMVHAFTSTDAYSADFNRTSCSDLGTNIQARFEPDVSSGNSSNTMTIKEVGSQSSFNNDGAFKFDETSEGQEYYASNLGAYQYPSIEGYSNFHAYNITSANLTLSEPIDGTSNAVVLDQLSMKASYNANFSSTGDEFTIAITQSSTDIVILYHIVSSSGVLLDHWTLDQPISGTLNPPYHNYLAVDELAGLESEGYAILHSGTDVQIESVIQPDTVSDFTAYYTIHSTASFQQFTTPCVSWYTDDEGGGVGTWTYQTSGTDSTSNEAYQYTEVTD